MANPPVLQIEVLPHAEGLPLPSYQTEARAHREAALERTIWMASTPLG